MISIVKQTIDFYLQKMSVPEVSNLTLSNDELGTTKWSCFVTIFEKWIVRWSSWNIKEIEQNLAKELISNTIQAISKDSRFKPLTMMEAQTIKIRVDFIKNRSVLSRTDDEAARWVETLWKIDPVKNWVIVIKKDYSKSATILPNIDPKILVWTDYQDLLSSKLEENFDENKYIIYKIETIVESNY